MFPVSGNDGVLYSYNQEGAITSFSAILFHPRSLGPQANASIQPNSVLAGQNFQQFKYRFDSIDPAGDPTDLGKVDSVAITNPFTSNSPIVTDVKINSAQALLQNSTNPPTQYDCCSDFAIRCKGFIGSNFCAEHANFSHERNLYWSF